MNYNKIIAREILVLFSVLFITLGVFGYYKIQKFRLSPLLKENEMWNTLNQKLKWSNKYYDFYLKSQNGYEFWKFAKSKELYTKSFKEFGLKYKGNEDKLFEKTISNSDIKYAYVRYFNDLCYNCEVFGNPASPLQVYIIETQNYELFKKYFFPKTLVNSKGQVLSKNEFLNKLKYVLQKFPNVNSEDMLLARRFFNNFSKGDPNQDYFFSWRIWPNPRYDQKSILDNIDVNNKKIAPLLRFNISSNELYILLKDIFLYLVIFFFGFRYTYYIILWSIRTIKS